MIVFFRCFLLSLAFSVFLLIMALWSGVLLGETLLRLLLVTPALTLFLRLLFFLVNQFIPDLLVNEENAISGENDTDLENSEADFLSFSPETAETGSGDIESYKLDAGALSDDGDSGNLVNINSGGDDITYDDVHKDGSNDEVAPGYNSGYESASKEADEIVRGFEKEDMAKAVRTVVTRDQIKK